MCPAGCYCFIILIAIPHDLYNNVFFLRNFWKTIHIIMEKIIITKHILNFNIIFYNYIDMKKKIAFIAWSWNQENSSHTKYRHISKTQILYISIVMMLFSHEIILFLKLSFPLRTNNIKLLLFENVLYILFFFVLSSEYSHFLIQFQFNFIWPYQKVIKNKIIQMHSN